MNVIMLSPGFPGEMPLFAHGLAQVGAKVMGIGEQPERALPELARQSLVAYLQVESLWDEDSLIDRVRRWTSGLEVHRIECLWEPAMVLCARLREAVGVVGMTPEQRQELARLLEADEEISPEWARVLFPPEKREYELVYHGKDRGVEGHSRVGRVRASLRKVGLQSISRY